jgi:hypothetical protein
MLLPSLFHESFLLFRLFELVEISDRAARVETYQGKVFRPNPLLMSCHY